MHASSALASARTWPSWRIAQGNSGIGGGEVAITRQSSAFSSHTPSRPSRGGGSRLKAAQEAAGGLSVPPVHSPIQGRKRARSGRLREPGSLMPLASSTAPVKHHSVAQAKSMRSNGENTLAAQVPYKAAPPTSNSSRGVQPISAVFFPSRRGSAPHRQAGAANRLPSRLRLLAIQPRPAVEIGGRDTIGRGPRVPRFLGRGGLLQRYIATVEAVL